MRQRNNHQNCMNIVSLLVCNYLTFLSKANEGGGGMISNLGCLCPLQVPGPTLLKFYALIFITFHIQELLSYQNAVKSFGGSFVCSPAQRCACELMSDSVGRCRELRKDLFLTLP